MSVLSRKNSREDYRLVGVHVPPQVHNYITLFTLARGVAKSNLFKELIDTWMTAQKYVGHNENLMEELAIRIMEQWQVKKKKHPRASFQEFINKVGSELLEKGLTKKQVDTIIHQIKKDGKN